MKEQHHATDGPERLPPILEEAFRSLGTAPVEVPMAIEGRVLAAARPQLAALRARRTFRARLAWVSTAAAAAGLAAWFVLGPTPELPVGSARMDIDRSGIVDVLDAFALARDAEAGRPSSRGDLNRDGVVDGADVELVIAQAVNLSNRRRR